jgi:hypothetical protein
MKHLLFFSLIFYGISSSAQVITASVEDRSRYMLHTIKWTSREKQGFPDGNNIIQIEKTGTKLQMGYTAHLDGMKHAIVIRKISLNGEEIAVNKLDGGEKTFGPIKTIPFDFNENYYCFIIDTSTRIQ